MSPAPDPGRRTGDPAVVGTGDAAFLDAPGLTADALFARIEEVLARMPVGAVLTAYTDDAAAVAEAPQRCAARDLTLLATITHDERDGTTLAMCRRGPAGGLVASPPEAPTAPTEPPPHPRPPPKT